jgi:tetratricopeptide (TPR) repeat protein
MPETPVASPLGLYRSGITGSLHRRSITVGRDTLVQDTVEILRKGIGRKPKHHFLFIGPRGIGKTHLLSLLEDEVQEQPDLNQAYHVVRFPEESHRVLSFSDFLLILCEILRDTLPEEPQWAELYQRLSTEERDELIIDTLVPAIRQRRRQRQQSLIIMLENLNQIFEQQLKDSRHVASLRGFFMEDNGCLLIATAPLHFGGVTDHQQPFYDFFDVQLLDQLSEDQTIDLIRRNLQWERRDDLLLDFENLRPKLLALYRMTGGSPRLTLMLYELIAYDAVTEVKVQFQILLDRITPFYQDRMRDLGPQERALLETMASMRDQEKTPTAIAARMRMKTAQVSVLLNRLTKSQYLKSTESPRDKRSRLYAIREGFFDIWLAMNLNRAARQRMPFLVEFFAEFYPSIEERNRKREEYRRRLARGEFEVAKAAPARSDLLDGLDHLSEVGTAEERAAEKLRLASLHAAEGNATQAQRYLQEAHTLPLDGMGQWIVANAGSEPDTDYLTEIEDLITCWETFRSGNLESFADRLKATGANLSFRGWSETKISFLRDHLALLPEARDRIETRLKLGHFLRTLARWPEAETELRAALTEATAIGDSDFLVQSLAGIGLVLQDTNRLAEAELFMRRALENAERSYTPDHPNIAICVSSLGLLLMHTNRMAEAEPLLRRALANSEESLGPNDSVVATHMDNLAQLLKATNRGSEAEPLMRRALVICEQGVASDDPDVAIRLNNLAQFLQDTNRLSEAEPLIRRALAIDEQSFGPDHPKVAIRLTNLASLLQSTNRLSEAESLLRHALSIFQENKGPTHPHVATTLNNLGILLMVTGRPAESESLMRRALSIDEQSFGPQHPSVAIHLNNLAKLLMECHRAAEAEPLIRRTIQIFLRFTVTTGHPHPNLRLAIRNFQLLAKERGHSEEQIIAELLKIAEETQFPVDRMQQLYAELSS